jgi:hypothetical protein
MGATVFNSLICFSGFVKSANEEFVFVPAKDEATVSGDLIPTRSRGHRCKTFDLKRKRRVDCGGFAAASAITGSPCTMPPRR